MPEARSVEAQRVVSKLGFTFARQRGSHQRWMHPDGRGITIPVHPSKRISGATYYDRLRGLGITEDYFNRLK